MNATEDVPSEREAVLRFDKAIVRRLVDHARDAPKSRSAYGEPNAEPALWLVGDAGVYLMSNGSPASFPDGQILMAPAEGCDTERDRAKNWRPIHNLFAEGSDFALEVALAPIETALSEALSQIVLVGNGDHYTIYSDIEYARISGSLRPN